MFDFIREQTKKILLILFGQILVLFDAATMHLIYTLMLPLLHLIYFDRNVYKHEAYKCT